MGKRDDSVSGQTSDKESMMSHNYLPQKICVKSYNLAVSLRDTFDDFEIGRGCAAER